ncbi:hypothetical protein PV728_01550 [Streptomyces europaeiscabiei]|uniref:hypothetical protein n=1 Tax=Streptomyces europaeiscabiei TaxID=146819 RepID=UPI0029B89E2E|nr:hypothetical protein [Streptomyces europaeiscabiei]MDX3629013.1 hypothetical protein [Streptomyces europaeiscabiei]MDX3647369.1 hypothetical protein [Streptomyces europaeiscabiei]
MSVDQEQLRPPREADLIRVARLARGLSPEKAAELTPIRLGGARWRHIERGYEPKKPPKRVRAPDKTLAHMAHVVGVSPERLEEVGRGIAAEILREILRQEAESGQAEERPYADMSDRLERTAWEMPLAVEERKLIVDMLRQAKVQGRSERSA